MWLAVDKNGEEFVFEKEPFRSEDKWCEVDGNFFNLLEGSVEKLLEYALSWDNEAEEILQFKK
jgi:hypothetical protein